MNKLSILAFLLLSSCHNEYQPLQAREFVTSIRGIYGNKTECLYQTAPIGNGSITDGEKYAFVTGDNMYLIRDRCGRFSIGDTIQISFSKIEAHPKVDTAKYDAK